VARDPLVRSGLVAVLSEFPGLVLKEASAESRPGLDADVVVGDAPNAPAVSSAAPPQLALVEAADHARAALRAGARGALSRSAPPSSIGPAALAVAAGHWVIDESFAGALVDLSPAPLGPQALLTPRETEVLALLAEGLSNVEIAERLSISRHTSKFHVNAILDKLGAESRTEAVVLAARSGLLTL